MVLGKFGGCRAYRRQRFEDRIEAWKQRAADGRADTGEILFDLLQLLRGFLHLFPSRLVKESRTVAQFLLGLRQPIRSRDECRERRHAAVAGHGLHGVGRCLRAAWKRSERGLYFRDRARQVEVAGSVARNGETELLAAGTRLFNSIVVLCAAPPASKPAWRNCAMAATAASNGICKRTAACVRVFMLSASRSNP